MQVRQRMHCPPVRIHPEESAWVAARTFAHYGGILLTVCGSDGKLQGVLTQGDLIRRCMAPGRDPGQITAAQIMTASPLWAAPEMEADRAEALMQKHGIPALPVLANGKLCGVVTRADLETGNRG